MNGLPWATQHSRIRMFSTVTLKAEVPTLWSTERQSRNILDGQVADRVEKD